MLAGLQSRRRWAWALGIRPSVNMELALPGPGREDGRLGAVGDYPESSPNGQFAVAIGAGVRVALLRVSFARDTP